MMIASLLLLKTSFNTVFIFSIEIKLFQENYFLDFRKKIHGEKSSGISDQIGNLHDSVGFHF